MEGGGLAPLSFGRTFEVQSSGGSDRLVVTAPKGWGCLLRQIVFRHPGPYACAYEERRAEGDLEILTGPLNQSQVDGLVEATEEFLESDPRHSFTLGTVSPAIRVVLDEHNFLHVFGDLPATKGWLETQGFVERAVTLPTPHIHKDFDDLDPAAARLIRLVRALA